MNSIFLLFSILCLLGLSIRTSYEVLKKGGKVDSKNKMVFAIVFVGMILMLTSWIVMGLMNPWHLPLPMASKWVGFILLILGLGLAIGGLIQLRGLENIDHLETSGLYRKIRHPMYAGFIFWIAGWVIYFNAGASLLVGIVATGNILYWRSLEEEQMGLNYGEEYRLYRASTWF